MLKKILCAAFIVLILAGCENKTEEGATASNNSSSKEKLMTTQPSAFLEEPSEALVVETPAEALPTWRKHSISKPALLLMAKNPLLQTIPEEVREQVKALVKTGEIDAFRQQALATAVVPLMLPNMSLSAALDVGLFSRVIWVLPAAPGTEVTLEAFRKKLLDLNVITPAEADSFHGEDNGFAGMIRGVPFTIALKSSLPMLKEPVVLHLDIGFLSVDYQNEIKTPLYKHTDSFLAELKTHTLKVLAVTLCASNLTSEVSLRSRFLAHHIRSIITDPTLLDKALDGNAALRNEALYLGSFFKKDEVLAIHRKMVANSPEDASAHYDLYQTLRQFDEIDEALEHLERAAAADQVYAMEYLELTEVALKRNRLGGALNMLRKATVFFPDNPYLEIGQADILIRMGHVDEPKTVLAQLKKLSWSTTYHVQMPSYLDEMLAAAEENESSESKSKTGSEGYP